jgi:hypothetical protein
MRISVGIEDVDDLIDDLKEAFEIDQPQKAEKAHKEE